MLETMKMMRAADQGDISKMLMTRKTAVMAAARESRR